MTQETADGEVEQVLAGGRAPRRSALTSRGRAPTLIGGRRGRSVP